MRILLAALAVVLSLPAPAQDMFKCKNAAGKITYTSRQCGELGLSPAGTVADRTSAPPAPASASPAKPGLVSSAKPKAPAPAGADKAPGHRCMTVKRGKGDVVTLCDGALKAFEGKPRTF